MADQVELEEKEVQSTVTEKPGEKPTEAQNQGDLLKGVTFEDGEETEVEEESEVQTKTEGKTPETPEAKVEATPAAKPEESESVEKRISKLTFKRHEEREKREEAERKLAEAQAEIKRLKGESDKVVIPPMPDSFDENYAEKVKAREVAIAKQAEFEAQAKIEQNRLNEQRIAQQQAVLKAIQTNKDKMYATAKTHGFKEEDFAEADVKVSKFIRSPEVATFILEREDSSLIVQHLANDVEALEKLGRMSPVNAAVFLATEIASKAAALKPKASSAPEPLEIVKGRSGGNKEDSPFLNGVSFE